ncbi:MAG: hypothetical protein RJA63_3446 [Pseudomonadota bacterium]|jgi:outer membrane protein TolC
MHPLQPTDVSKAPLEERRQMSRSLIVLLATGVLCGHGSLVAAAGLSFSDARTMLQARSDAMHAASAELRYREYEAEAASAMGYPEVGLNAKEVGGHKTMDLGTFPVLGKIKKEVELGGPRSSITMNWPIYTGGRITAAQEAKAADTDVARAEQRETAERLDSELVRRYFGLRLAEDVERLRLAQFDQANRDFERALQFEKQGQLSALERLSAQVARDEAEREFIKAGHERSAAEAALARLLRDAGPVQAASPLFVLTRSLPPLAEWLAAARETNPNMATLQARQSAAKQGVVAAQASYKPEVFAYGEYNLIKRNLSLTEPNWIAGVGVSIKLFAREDRASKVNAARAQVERVEALRAETRNRVEMAVEAAWLRADQARRQFELFGSSLELARENLRLRGRAFEEGQTTVLEVSEARNALLRAATGRAQIAYEFDIALISLLEACGQTGRYTEFLNTADVSLLP